MFLLCCLQSREEETCIIEGDRKKRAVTTSSFPTPLSETERPPETAASAGEREGRHGSCRANAKCGTPFYAHSTLLFFLT